MSLLNVGARALLANQSALQTAGHNIANVNVPGYSRQSVVMESVPGQQTGNGYIGKGVNVAALLRSHDELLTRQATAAAAQQAGDGVRAERLFQLQDIFPGGASGLGAAVNDMLNALGDVITSPTDISARMVTLTRMDEMATRMRSSSEQLHQLEYSVTEQLKAGTRQINNLSSSIAEINGQIARLQNTGQAPNDLLDRRDQLIRELNRYIQTTQIPASDGTVSVFAASSQALVLGTTPAQLVVDEGQLFPGGKQLGLYFSRPGSPPVELAQGMLGGGEVSGLLRFANNDLAEARNLLGRMALAIGTSMNQQQALGLTLDGDPGKPLFSTPAAVQGITSATGSAAGGIDFSDPGLFTPARFAASDYEVRFSDAAPAGSVVRLSDGKTVPFDDLDDLRGQQIDGLTFDFTAAGAPGERVLFRPFANAAAEMQALVHSPRDLAVANPVNAQMGASNTGSLQLAGLKATGQVWDATTSKVVHAGALANLPPSPIPPATTGGGVTLIFAADGTFSINGAAAVPLDMRATPPVPMASAPYPPYPYPYTPGQSISIDGWEITLQGTPQAGDTVTVGNARDAQYGDWYSRDAGNAKALLALRDVKMFDDSTLTDGYAGLMAQVGTRAQSASYAAQLSGSIAANLEASRTAVSGVNLDEEAARLIQYQQSYQASAKMLQVAQSIFDNLLQSLSR